MHKPGGHPCLDLLLRYIRRELSPLMFSEVSEHVCECEHCKRRVAKNLFRPREKEAA